jgi:serine/threonine-protein kinase RsbW
VPTSCDLPRSIASLDALFSFLGEHIEAAAIDETTAYGLNLAAEELFTNMVRHNVGEGEFISVDLDISDERIRLLLTDHDVDPFDPSSVPVVDVTRPAEDRQPGGLGMHLVRSIVDRVSYEYENREMRVSVIKNRSH